MAYFVPLCRPTIKPDFVILGLLVLLDDETNPPSSIGVICIDKVMNLVQVPNLWNLLLHLTALVFSMVLAQHG